MNFAKFSVSKPIAVTMRIASLVLLGAICLTKLPIDLLPKVSIPTVAVTTVWPNVAPEALETQITRVVEQAVSSAPNVQQVSSNTTTGTSTVRVQFNWGTDIGQAAVDVLQLVQRARTQFPNDPTLQNPLVFKYDPSTLPIMIFGVSGDMDSIKLRQLMQNEVSPILESSDGVAAATITGGQQRAIIVDVDPIKLQSYGISLDTIQKRIVQENIDIPAGIAKQGNTEFTIRSVGYFNNTKDASRIPITSVNGKMVTLGDVANVRDSHQETRISTRINGQDSVGVIITKQSEANTVATAQSVLTKVEEAKKLYPQLKFQLAYDQSGFIENSIDELKNTAIIGGVLAVLILMFFLRNVRSTLVVALSIPTSIISTFALLYFCGFTINTISLSGLALASGLIVDDAVVVLENIFRHIEQKREGAAEGAISGTNEITSAVIASTITVMVVFMPILLIKGQSGQMFTQFALVVIFSMAVSLLDALTIVPMLASKLIKEREVFEDAHPEKMMADKTAPPLKRFFGWAGVKLNELDASYHRALSWAIKHRWTVVLGAIGVSGASFLFVPMIGSELLPQTDSGDFTVNVKLPIGTAYAKTDETMKIVEGKLQANPDVESVLAVAGSTLSLRGTSTAQISYAGSATVHLKGNRKKKTQDIIKVLQKDLAKIPGVRAIITPYDPVAQILTGGATNMEVDVFGQDIKVTTETANQVMAKLRGVPGLEGVDLGVQEATPELRWKVDREKALALGVTFQDIANALNTSTNGSLSSYYQEGGFQYPIYVQLPEADRKSAAALMELPITPSIKNGSGIATSVPLKQVATPYNAFGPNEITRLNRQRYLAITGRVSGRSEGEIQADIQAELSKFDFPQGTYWKFGTNQTRRAEEFSGMGLAVVLAIALIYMLLASQFESFTYPLVVLTAVPLCSPGVILGLFLTGRAFGLTAYIGLLMLVGIVVKNGILLVDYTNQLRERGLNREDAILTASPTRLRPILMTTFAAVLGMLPLALAIGKGSETQAPLATAVVCGLSTSTLLTLFVVPCIYSLFDDLANRFKKQRDDGGSTPGGSNSDDLSLPIGPDLALAGRDNREI